MVPNVDKLSAIFTKGQANIESEKYSPKYQVIVSKP